MNLHNYQKNSIIIETHQKLIAVSKGQDVEKIKLLYDKGHRDFGENFLQELKEKKGILPDDINWHFLGNIQSNKIKDIVACSNLIHSIGRMKILDKILNVEPKNNIEILLQLKLGKEDTKAGFSETEIYEIMESRRFKNIVLKGLMVIGEGKIKKETLKKQFLQANDVFKKMQLANKDVEYLSMGMSSDCLLYTSPSPRD